MTIFRGLTNVYTDGTPISGLSKAIMTIGNGKLYNIIPYPVIITIEAFVMARYVLN